MFLAYIMNMSSGIQGFTYREMEYLRKNGTEICIYYTKYGTGPYMPEEKYDILHYNVFNVLFSQILTLVRRPNLYFELIFESIKSNTFTLFLISVYFAEDMKKKNIDQIHSTFGGDKLLIGYYCKKILGLKLSVTVHSYELEDNIMKSSNRKYQLSKKAYRYSDRIVTISNWNKRQLIKKFFLPARRINVIRLCSLIEEQSSSPSDLSDLSEEELSCFKILIVGNSFERKGHEILFKAIDKLNSEKIRVWVVSQAGPINLKQKIKEMKLESKVRFFGSVSHLKLIELYKLCDIYCLPAFLTDEGDHEGIPVSIMDAMAFSKPVVSTRHTGIPELVEEILVEERDIDGLSNAILRLQNNPKLCESLGQRNYEIIREKYSETNHQRFLEEVVL